MTRDTPPGTIENPAAQEPAYPAPTQGWLLVGLLMIAYIFSYVDRGIIGLLIEPIKADLDLTDEQFSLIYGLAFSVFYATMGIPLGWLVDRKRRTVIIAFGILIWSAATAASGLAKNFFQLFIARMGVGAGEATLSPSAFSMIADSFPPEKRGKPIAVYSVALTIGGAIASLIGATVIVWAKKTPLVTLPVLGDVASWQVTFFLVGLPGLLLGIAFFFVTEPARRDAVARDKDLKSNDFKDAIGYIWSRKATYGLFVSLICVMTIIAYSQGNFLPGTFERTWGWPAEKYATVNFYALLAVGPATYLLVGWLSDKWSQQGIQDAPFKILVFGFVLMVPASALATLMPNAIAAFIVLSFSNVGIGIVSAVGVTALLNITPAKIRGQVVAIYYMAISLSGLLLGPTTVGVLATRVFGEANLQYAVAVVPLIYGIIPMVFIPMTRKLYLKQMVRLGMGHS
jgi:MFS family permease